MADTRILHEEQSVISVRGKINSGNNTHIDICTARPSLAGQPLCKREEGSGVMPICDLYRYSQECSPIRLLTSPLILCGYWYAGWPIRGPLFLFNKLLGLSLPRVLTNQVLDLHEAGDHNSLLKTKSRHLIGQPKYYLDSSTILVVTWHDLIGLHSWLQQYKSRIGVTPDPSSLLRRGWPARLCKTCMVGNVNLYNMN